jgi:hypothetical protein
VTEEILELPILHLSAHAVLNVEVDVSDLHGAGRVGAEHVDRAHVVDVETAARHVRQQFD